MLRHRLRYTVLAAVLLFAARLSSAAAPALPDSARRTSQAFDQLNSGHFSAAITLADGVIRTYRGPALLRQQQLAAQARKPGYVRVTDAKTGKVRSQHLPFPTGSIPRQVFMDVMAIAGPLNDVASCYFIKGKALEGLNRNGEACAAYKECMKFTMARCWDPGPDAKSPVYNPAGWLWSQADGAKGQRLGLQCGP